MSYHCQQCGHRQSLHYRENGYRKCLGESFECLCIKQYYESDSE